MTERPPAPRPTPREAAIAGILGLSPDADAAGLLGVDASRTDEGEIVAALNQRLAMVNAHRFGGTPLGDEARLALHAAAARLLGSQRRAGAFDRDLLPASASDEPGRHTLPPAHLALQQDAVLALGAHGGWNAATMRHLTMLAHARGLTGDDLAVALSRLARQSTTARPAAANGSMDDRAASSDPGRFAPAMDAPLRSSTNDLAMMGAMAIAVILTLVAAAAVLIAIPVMRTGGLSAASQAQADGGVPRVPDAPDAPVPGAPATPEATITAGPARDATPMPTPITRPDTVVTDLRLASDRRRRGDASASVVFEKALSTFADAWPDLRPDIRRAAMGAVIDYLYLIREDASATQRAVAFLTGPLAVDGASPSMAARVWQVGAVVRLTREQNLPAAVVDGLRRFVNATAPVEARAAADYPSGAAVALRHELDTLVKGPSQAPGFVADPSAWAGWIACARGLAMEDHHLGQRLLLSGLEAVVLRGPEPTDERVFHIFRRFVVELSWRPEDPARARLLAWFKDPAVTVADLHALTNVLATASAAPGVDPTMVLPALATPAQRSQIMDRFAAAWNVQSAQAHGEIAERWLGEARRHGSAQTATDAAAFADDAAVSARLVASATLLWQGMANEADGTLLHLRQGIGAAAAPRQEATRTIYLAAHSTPSRWAVRYLEQRRPELRADMLEQLARNGPAHAVEAELAVDAFLRGTTPPVRQWAEAVIGRYAGTAMVVAAVLEALPLPASEARRREMVELVTGIRLPRGGDWEIVARRVLVERLLELMAAEGELSRIDRAAEIIAHAYGLALSATPDGQPSGDNPPELSAQLLWNQARARADRLVPPASWPLPPSEIDRRLTGRTRLAQGRVQWFAAYQSALAEIELYNAAAERPALVPMLTEVLDDMQRTRREATSVLSQIAIVERARLRVWVLRLDASSARGPY